MSACPIPCLPDSIMTAASDLVLDPNIVIAGLASNGITTTEYVYNSRYIIPLKTDLVCSQISPELFEEIKAILNSPDNVTIVPTSIYKEVCCSGQLPFAVNFNLNACRNKRLRSRLLHQPDRKLSIPLKRSSPLRVISTPFIIDHPRETTTKAIVK